MYTVITNDNKVPKELDGFVTEIWTLEQFVKKCNDQTDGFSVDEGLWYHVTELTEDIYNQLKFYVDDGAVDIMYYCYKTDVLPDFEIDKLNLCTDPDEPAVEEPEPEPDPVSEPDPEPIKEPEPVVEVKEPDPEPEIEIQPPVVQEVPKEPEPSSADLFAKFNENINKTVFNHNNEQPKVEEPKIDVQAPVVSTPVVSTPVVEQTPAPTLAPAPVATNNDEVSHSEIGGIAIAESTNKAPVKIDIKVAKKALEAKGDDFEKTHNGIASVILFGSAKGGTGKTFTACASAHHFALTHPNLRIALADFDIIDGQVAITTNQIGPTVKGYYKDFKAGRNTFADLYKYHANSFHFGNNLDFYLAPEQDIPEITNNNEFWKNIYTLLVKNYDVVIFDSGIDYMGKQPISELYKIANKIIITCNISINSVKSITKQLQTLSGQRQNIVFDAEDAILDRTNIVLTRVSDEYQNVNEEVVSILGNYVDIIAAFGNIDSLIYQVQWAGAWDLIEEQPEIVESLDTITSLSEDE